MKQFREYLTEAEKSYDYRIKIVGDVGNDFIKDLESRLSQFDVIKFSTVKSTPVQMKPADFPAHANERVSNIDVVLRYPAIEPQIKQISQLLGLDPNRIIMQTPEYLDGMDSERKKIEDQNTNLLTDTDFPSADSAQKALSKEHADGNQQVLKNAYKSKFTIAGGKTPTAKTTNDLPMGNKSPMTNIKRPAKPTTGAGKKG